jgi:cytochrome c-type biogenesis protein CcmH/NrfG
MEYRKTIVERLIDCLYTYRREVLLVFALMGVVGGSVTGYFWYKDRIARRAHKEYAAVLELRDARVVKGDEIKGAFETTFTSEQDKWEAVSAAFGKVYNKYTHIGVGIMAGAAQAQSLVRLGRFDEARTIISDVISRVTSPQLRALYTLNYAQMLVDSTDQQEVETGLGMMAKLAATKESPVHDSALYYLGLHYWYTSDFASARNYWSQLMLHYQSDVAHSSPWVSMVQEKLALIEVDEASA